MKTLLSTILVLTLVIACGGADETVEMPDIRLSGDVDMVTENYKIPECQKSVFVWSIEPTADGDAQLIVHIHKQDKDEYRVLLNELEFTATEKLQGEKAFPLSGGEYFFSVESVKGAWTLEWECRD